MSIKPLFTFCGLLLLGALSATGNYADLLESQDKVSRDSSLLLLKKCLYWDSRSTDSLRFYFSKLDGEPSEKKLRPYLHYILGRVESSAERRHENLLLALSGAMESNDLQLAGLSHYRLGRMHSAKGVYDSALLRYQIAHELLSEKGDNSLVNAERRKCVVYTSQAFISNQLNDYASSVEYSLASIRIAEKNGYSDLQLTSMINLSAAYGELGSPDNRLGTEGDRDRYTLLSKNMMFDAANLAQQLGDKRRMHRTLSNIGIYYGYEDEIDSSKQYLNRAIAIGEEIKDLRGLVNDYNMLSLMFKKSGDLDSAKYYAERAIENARAVASPRMEASILITLGELAFEKGNKKEARLFLNQAIDLAKRFSNPKSASHAYDLLHQLSQSDGEMGRALEYYKNSVIYRDSVASNENFNRIEELKITYETEKKEQQIQSLEQEAVIANLKIRQQNIQLLGTLSFLLIGAIAGFTIYRNRNLKAEQQRLMVEQKLLRSQMNPHFLFNALSSVHGYIYEGDKKQASEYLSMFSELTRDILDHSSRELIQLSKELNTLEKYVNLQRVRFSGISYKVEVLDSIEPTEICIPPMLLQPFVENAIEHGLKGQQSGNITVRVRKQGNEIHFQVIDDGVGLGSEENQNHQSKAIEIARERISLLPGMKKRKDVLTVQNQEKGVLVELKLPLLEWV